MKCISIFVLLLDLLFQQIYNIFFVISYPVNLTGFRRDKNTAYEFRNLVHQICNLCIISINKFTIQFSLYFWNSFLSISNFLCRIDANVKYNGYSNENDIVYFGNKIIRNKNRTEWLKNSAKQQNIQLLNLLRPQASLNDTRDLT